LPRLAILIILFYNDFNEIFSEVDCSRGVVFIVLTDTKWTKGYSGYEVMGEIVGSTEKLYSFDKIGNCSYSTVYLANPPLE
jgi:hypothetical protein